MKRVKHTRSLKTAQDLYQSEQLMFWDKFTDANGINLSAHTNIYFNPLKLSWVKDNVLDLPIYSDKLTTTGVGPQPGSEECDHYIEMYDTKFRVECDIQYNGPIDELAFPAILLRYASKDAHFSIIWQQLSTYAICLVTLRKQDGGTSTDVGAIAVPYALRGTEQNIWAEDDGNTITFGLDGYQSSYTTTDYSANTKVGLKGNKELISWDNFKVYKI